MRAGTPAHRTRSGPGTCRPSSHGRRLEGPVISGRRSITPTRDSSSMHSSGSTPSSRMYHGLDEPELDTLHFHVNDAEFSVGDFELNYRMHQRAGRAIKAVLEGAVDEAVRNEAAFRLARIHFQKDQLDDAQQALARIHGVVPAQIRDDVEFLRANVDMATGRPGEAVKVLQQVKSDAEPFRFCRVQPWHRAVAGRSTTGSDRAAGQGWPASGRRCRRSCDPRQVATWCLAACCSNPATLSGQSSRWTAFASMDRFRTRLCCGQALPRHRPSSMTARSFRGTSWWSGSRRMPRFRKPCLPCRTPMPA